MKKTLLFTFLMAIVMFGVAQTVVFSDNFDSYTAGSYLAQSNSAWTTWDNLPGTSQDGVISTAQAASTPNSLYISGSNDQVFPFGNYTSGHYTIAFNYYVPSSGNGAYFNLQHILLQQWAFECFFYNTGSGYISVNNNTYQFTCSCDTWFPILIDVDMDNDLASLTINNTLVHTWTFSSTTSDPGTNQLAGINFYAGCPTNPQSGTYYVDDFVITELNAALIGEFAVSPNSLYTSIAPGASENLNLALNNPGTGSTNYKIITTYDIPDPDTTSTGMMEMAWWQLGVYVVGFDSACQYDLAVGFPDTMMREHIGKTLRTISIPLSAEITSAKIRVYSMGKQMPMDGPGEIIYEQSFTPIIGFNNVTLEEPVIIDGGDLWIGVWIDQPASVRPFYIDSVLRNNYSCWSKKGNSTVWQPSNGTNDLCISAFIDGTPITTWLDISSTEGILAAGEGQNISLNVNTSGMSIGESHTAKLHCFSTDPDNRELVVPVTMNIVEVSVNDYNQIEVSIYPNPSSEYVNVTADLIERVEIFNMAGQKVLEKSCNDSHVVISTGDLSSGTYLVTVITNSGQTTKKVMIR